MVEPNTAEAGQLGRLLEQFYPNLLGPLHDRDVRAAQMRAWCGSSRGYDLETIEVALADFAASFEGYNNPKPGNFRTFLRNGHYKPKALKESKLAPNIKAYSNAGIEFDLPEREGKPSRRGKIREQGIEVTEEGKSCFVLWGDLSEEETHSILDLAAAAVVEMGQEEFDYRRQQPGGLREAYQMAKDKGLTPEHEDRWKWLAGLLGASLERRERKEREPSERVILLLGMFEGLEVELPKARGWEGETVAMGKELCSCGVKSWKYKDLDNERCATLLGQAQRQYPDICG